ncbi:hypothetical protein LCGC14_2184200 [marine sediment metagenome]|uniref:Uncharacterized protein n=1 Tax=marine sediment metagenome TaxID=412755 RepID=A0A0F9GH65_9ZZZZ
MGTMTEILLGILVMMAMGVLTIVIIGYVTR